MEKLAHQHPTIIEFERLQEQKSMCVSLLNQQGFSGDKLRAQLREKVQQEIASLTVPQSQERVDAIMHCKIHGKSFMATGGMPLTADEAFLATEKEKKQNQLKDMYTDKKSRIVAEKRETMGLNLIQKQIQDKDLKVEDLNVLLGWHQVKVTGLSKVQKFTK